MNPYEYHRRELEQRIRKFDGECEIAINHIKHLKVRVCSFLDQLSCEPRELKNSFLQCTKQLDEFMYCVTEFNLIASNLENNVGMGRADEDCSPTPKSNRQSKTHSQHSLTHSNTWLSAETKTSRTKQAKQLLKENNWRERSSDPSKTIKTKEICENIEQVTAPGNQPVGLPRQHTLDPASVSKATIVNANGAQLWLVVNDDELANLIQEMSEYYKDIEIDQDYIPESVCSYYDEAETNCYFRAIYMKSEEGPDEVFLVDTGEFQPAPQSRLRPLHPRFRLTPPLAHLCCLADVEQTEDNDLEDRQTDFLKQFLGQRFKIKFEMYAEDDSSKPVPVYLYLEDGTTINELLVRALASSKPELKEKSTHTMPNIPDEKENIQPNLEFNNVTKLDVNERVNKIDIIKTTDRNKIDIEDELDYSESPEYENALEAVTGYNNRDEIDICKHYTGGEGCFKGHRCKKRHVMMHPDGWTLDRVSVVTKCRPAALPAPGSRLRAKVTHVDGTCRLYVQFEPEDEPMSLIDLVEEMTVAATDSKHMQLDTAPGELVSARFTDGRYYRARVISADDTNTEVIYIDYGNSATVPNVDLRPLEPRWMALPVQAVPCRLAGLSDTGMSNSRVSDTRGSDATDAMSNAAEVLSELALNKIMEAHIISRDFDELTVKLDDDGFDIAEQLAAFTGLKLKPYSVDDDSKRHCHHVPA